MLKRLRQRARVFLSIDVDVSQSPAAMMRALSDSVGKAFLTVAVICSIAFLSAWCTGLIVEPPPNWPVRYRFFGIAFVLGLGGVYLWARNVAQHQMAAQRYFNALSEVDELKFAQGTLAGDLPVLGPTNPWYGPATKFSSVFRSHCERVEQLEHARAALEVRLKRNATREAQIAAVLTNLSEGVIAVDGYDQILLVNPTAQRLLGIDLDATEYRDMSHVLPNEEMVELLSEIRRRKAPAQRSIEIELPDEDDKPHTYSVTARSLSPREQRGDEAAALAGAFAVLRDVSQLKASNKRNAEFVSAVSHEMKTPLAGIKAYVELLADADAPDEQTREEFLGVISTQANRLQRLIDNLLNLARIEAGVVQVSKSTTSLNELLLETLNIVRPAAEAKHIALTSDLSELYLGVLVDRDMMMQGAINLLSNAIKYTPDGGRVTLRSRLVDNQAIFEVEDTGVGLSDEDKQRVFEKFYRVKKDRNMAAGTGLGLPLAKHIVEDVHGGRLTVESQVGKGSTFSVALPIAAQMACQTSEIKG